MAKLPVKGGLDRPLRLRAKNIAPSARGIGKQACPKGIQAFAIMWADCREKIEAQHAFSILA